jgi:hypothetical protein
MEKKTQVRIAFAEAFMVELWRRGLITTQQRDSINKRNRDKLRNFNC